MCYNCVLDIQNMRVYPKCHGIQSNDPEWNSEIVVVLEQGTIVLESSDRVTHEVCE